MTSDKYQWQLTEIAENDIDEATAYIAQELQNPDAASHLLDEIKMLLTGYVGLLSPAAS